MGKLEGFLIKMQEAGFSGVEIASALFLSGLSLKQILDILAMESYDIDKIESSYHDQQFSCYISEDNTGSSRRASLFCLEGDQFRHNPELEACFFQKLRHLQGVCGFEVCDSIDEEWILGNQEVFRL